MLILTRKLLEEIKIIVPPTDTETVVTLKVTKINKGSTSYGLDAPRHVLIRRGELTPIPNAAPPTNEEQNE